MKAFMQTDLETIIKEKMQQAQARAEKADYELLTGADGLPLGISGQYSGGDELALYTPFALESGEVVEDMRLLFSVELGEPFIYGDHPDYGGGAQLRPVEKIVFDYENSDDDLPADLVELIKAGAYDKYVNDVLNG
jgi:hypothetical protein